ncbi:MAG: hypothetical protein MUD03_07355 [Pirellula sp.]|jgi:hypothetical protein|nr:hypothetical protein [Pirellula sp.]
MEDWIERSFARVKILVDTGATPLPPGSMQITPLQRAQKRKKSEGRKVYKLLLNNARIRYDCVGKG